MQTVLWTVLVVAFAGFMGARMILKPILAFVTTPSSDLTRIRANLEGVLGEAGPGKQVMDIVHSGGTLATRSTEAERTYIVTLARPDGTTEQKTVKIEVAFMGQGRMTVERSRDQ